jgi:hypothetical protein
MKQFLTDVLKAFLVVLLFALAAILSLWIGYNHGVTGKWL